MPPYCFLAHVERRDYGRHIGELIHLQSPGDALVTIVGEHDRMLKALMATVDLIALDQAEGGGQIKVQGLREATGATMRDSIAKRDRALDVLLDD